MKSLFLASQDGDVWLDCNCLSLITCPVDVAVVAIAVTGGNYHTCVATVVTNGSSVMCWGGNNHGELGIGIRGPSVLHPTSSHLPFGGKRG